MNALMLAAQIAGAIIAIVTAVALVGRYLLRIPIIASLHTWIVEGWRQDREERVLAVLVEHLPEVLDETMAFNGTGSFRKDMRVFYLSVNEFMRESSEDRRALHHKVDRIQGEVE